MKESYFVNVEQQITGSCWQNIDRKDRRCNICKEAVIGDRLHYLLECNYFNDKRENLVGDECCARPNVIKLKKNNEQQKRPCVMKTFSLYIKIVFSIACPP